VSAPTEQQVPSVWDAYDAWLRRATTIIAGSADALNAMNVFPISDADTGSNLKLTLAGIAQAVPDVNRGSLDAIVQAAFYKGLLVLGAGKNAIRLSPPLTLTKSQATTALQLLDAAIGEVTRS